jgi:uncharacterized protein
VEKISDLRPGMRLEGVVTNVAAFGAFIDVGVHQDGLAHVSALSDRFVKDPRDVVKSGDVVMVKVLEVDESRKRISLTLRLDDEVVADQGGGRESHDGEDGRAGRGRGAGQQQGRGQGRRGGQGGQGRSGAPDRPQVTSAMAEALRRAGYQG